jgi:hypothetical protein
MPPPTVPSESHGRETEEPLPITLRFVFALGTFILIGWFLMFLLLQERW